MDKKRKPTKEHDFAVNAFRVVQEATEQIEPELEKPEAEKKPDISLHEYAVSLGRKGGLKGGKARLTKMTPEQRQDIARKAAQKRWAK
jgi:hypothetical protein